MRDFSGGPPRLRNLRKRVRNAKRAQMMRWRAA